MVSENELDRFHIALTKSILESRPPKFLYHNKRYNIDSLPVDTYPINSMNRDFDEPETWAAVSPDHDDETHQRGLDVIDEFFDVDGYQTSAPAPVLVQSDVAAQLAQIYQPSTAQPEATGPRPTLKAAVEVPSSVMDSIADANAAHDNAITLNASNPPMPSMVSPANPTPSILSAWAPPPVLTPPGAHIHDILSPEPQPLTQSPVGFAHAPHIDYPVSQTHHRLQTALNSPDGVLDGGNQGSPSPSVPPVIAEFFSPTGPILLNPEDSVPYQRYMARMTTARAPARLAAAASTGATPGLIRVAGAESDRIVSNTNVEIGMPYAMEQQNHDSDEAAGRESEHQNAASTNAAVVSDGRAVESSEDVRPVNAQPDTQPDTQPDAQPVDIQQDDVQGEATSVGMTQELPQPAPVKIKRERVQKNLAAGLATGDPASSFEQFLTNIDIGRSRQTRNRTRLKDDAGPRQKQASPAAKPPARNARANTAPPETKAKSAPRKIDTKPATRVTKQAPKTQTARKQTAALKRKK